MTDGTDADRDKASLKTGELLIAVMYALGFLGIVLFFVLDQLLDYLFALAGGRLWP